MHALYDYIISTYYDHDRCMHCDHSTVGGEIVTGAWGNCGGPPSAKYIWVPMVSRIRIWHSFVLQCLSVLA